VPCLDPVEVAVVRVVDGDTFDVEPAIELPDGGTVDRVRLLCVDAPEISGVSECYGTEAADWLTERLEGQQVTLHFSDECVGSYDRALVYVKQGGELLNLEPARQGLALPMDEWFSDYPCCEQALEAVEAAKGAGQGGWAECGGSPWTEW